MEREVNDMTETKQILIAELKKESIRSVTEIGLGVVFTILGPCLLFVGAWRGSSVVTATYLTGVKEK